MIYRVMIFSIILLSISCSKAPQGEWINVSPVHEDDLGWIVSGVDFEQVAQGVQSGDFSARVLHKPSGTFEIYGLTQREILKLTGRLASRNQFWPLKSALPTDKDDAKDYMSQLGVREVHKWNLGAGVRIAVIDTGLNIQHPEFEDKLTVNVGEIANNLVDDDSNGLIDDVQGWNFAANNNDLSDSVHHGTSVTSIIVSSNNGIAPLAEVLPLKVINSVGRIDEASVIAAIRYASDQKVDIINISLGKPNVSEEFKLAVQALEDQKIVLVTASGNDHKSCEIWKIFPAALKEDYIFSVSATGIQNPLELASYSNYGTCIDFALPAGDFAEGIPSAQWTGVASYTAFNGTSAAAPVLSGLVALLLSQYPELTPTQVKEKLISASQLPESLVGFVHYGIPKVDKILPPLTLRKP